MTKNAFLKVRLDPADMLNLEKQARLLNMPKSQFARLMLMQVAGIPQQKPEHQPPVAAGQIDDSRLAAMESAIAELQEASTQSAAAFDLLLSRLNEIMRVPTFTEFRARMHAEGIEKRENEDDHRFLLRLAQRYFIATGAWPDPADSRSFGRLPPGFDPAKFPKAPPG